MGMKKKYMINFIFIIVIILFFIYLKKSTNKFEEKLLFNGKFAIGRFEQFGYGYKAGGSNYKYSYDEDGRIRYVTGQRKMPDSELSNMIKNGDQFLVLYNNEGELIYFDKPIRDSTDFKRYVHEFEEMRKKKK